MELLKSHRGRNELRDSRVPSILRRRKASYTLKSGGDLMNT